MVYTLEVIQYWIVNNRNYSIRTVVPVSFISLHLLGYDEKNICDVLQLQENIIPAGNPKVFEN